MANRGEAPEVNAGSMADIAFLLLLFFLVTTSIETDVGFDRMLPRWNDDTLMVDIPKRNVLSIRIDGEGKLLVDEELTDLSEIRKLTIAFLDNGGAGPESPSFCKYCQGIRDPNSSDSPIKAIVSLQSSRETNYADYIAVQNELMGAYHYLRNREAQRLYKINFPEMETEYSKAVKSSNTKEVLKKELMTVQELYPIKLMETELK